MSYREILSRDMQTLKIVFVVCHPDDEAIWIGGLLNELPKLQNIAVYVICLSGLDQNSARVKEFEAAKNIAGYNDGVVLGLPLRPANIMLPNIAETIIRGLSKLKLAVNDINLLITHSPFGDEHLHPHHKQAYQELISWCNFVNIPFGYFSCLPIPFFYHMPILSKIKRINTLHLLQFSKCQHMFSQMERDAAMMPKGFAGGSIRTFQNCPKYYLQFASDIKAKCRMLKCYKSIGLAKHARNYAMFTNPCEAIYVMDDKGLVVFEAIIKQMNLIDSVELFQINQIDEIEREKIEYPEKLVSLREIIRKIFRILSFNSKSN